MIQTNKILKKIEEVDKKVLDSCEFTETKVFDRLTKKVIVRMVKALENLATKVK